MNETLEAIAKRFSCRDFTDRTPSDEDLQAIAQAALAAPSAMNRQPWQIIIVTNKALIEEMGAEGIQVLAAREDKTLYDRIMGRGGKLFYNAPCLVIIAIDETNPSGYEKIDIGIVAQTIVLAAASLGLASVHCGLAALPFLSERGQELKETLRFPEGYGMGFGVLLGYAKEPVSPHELVQENVTWIR